WTGPRPRTASDRRATASPLTPGESFVVGPIRRIAEPLALLVPDRNEHLAGVETAAVRRLGDVDDLDPRIDGQPGVHLVFQSRQGTAPTTEGGLVVYEQFHFHETVLHAQPGGTPRPATTDHLPATRTDLSHTSCGTRWRSSSSPGSALP